MPIKRWPLTSDTLLSAYIRGIFPMAHHDGTLYWHDPDPRAIFVLDELKPNSRTERFFRNKGTAHGESRSRRLSEHVADREECWSPRNVTPSRSSSRG